MSMVSNKLFPFMAILVLASSQVSASAEDFPIRYFPVALNIEGEYVVTSMLMKLPIMGYFDSEADFAGRATTPEAKVFTEFVGAVRTGDSAQVARLLYQEPAMADPGTSSVIMPPKTPLQFIQTYRGVFEGFADIMVVAQILSPAGRLFLWYGNTKNGPLLRGFLVHDVSGELRISEVTMARPVETMIVNYLGRLSQSELRELIRTDAPPSGERVALSLGPGNAALEINARFVDMDLYSATNLDDPGVSVLQSSAKALRAHDLGLYYSFFTPKSASRLKSWFSSMGTDGLAAYIQDRSRSRTVRMVIDGGPLSIVVSTDARNSIEYQYLLRIGEGSYRISNVLFQGFFDNFLNSSDALRGLVLEHHD